MPPKELPQGDSGENPPKKRSRFKIIMLIGSLLLVLGAGGGAGYWWLYMRPDATGLSGLFGSSKSASADEATKTDKEKTEQATPSSPGESASQGKPASASRVLIKPVALPSFTVNLADSPGNRYFKIGLEVELNSPDAAKEIQNQNARVRDSIILLLSSKTVKELTTPEGKVLLKNEVAARLNQILGAPRVVRIFFTDFVIQ